MAKITQLSQLDLDGTYTYADYLTWQFDEALELIIGKASPYLFPDLEIDLQEVFAD